MKGGGAVSVAAVGAVTAAGDDIESTSAAVRARLGAFRLEPRFMLSGEDPEWDPPEPLRAARAIAVGPHVEGPERLVALSKRALEQLAARGPLSRADMRETGLYMAVASSRDAPPGWSMDGFGARLVQSLGIEVAAMETVVAGYVSALVAIDEARRAIGEGRVRRAVVLAVDSYLSRDRIALYDERERLRSRRARDGFVPGEAAVALLLVNGESGAGTPSAGPLGLAQEAHPRDSDRAPEGRALEQAIRAAVGKGLPPRWVLCDMNGESGRAFEWGVARTRSPLLSDVQWLEHPAALVGDVGAATGALLVGLAHDRARSGVAPASSALVVCSSDDGARAAMVLSG